MACRGAIAGSRQVVGRPRRVAARQRWAGAAATGGLANESRGAPASPTERAGPGPVPAESPSRAHLPATERGSAGSERANMADGRKSALIDKRCLDGMGARGYRANEGTVSATARGVPVMNLPEPFGDYNHCR